MSNLELHTALVGVHMHTHVHVCMQNMHVSSEANQWHCECEPQCMLK